MILNVSNPFLKVSPREVANPSSYTSENFNTANGGNTGLMGVKADLERDCDDILNKIDFILK